MLADSERANRAAPPRRAVFEDRKVIVVMPARNAARTLERLSLIHI